MATPKRIFMSLAILLTLLLAFAVLLPASQTKAAGPPHPCTRGAAESALQALPIGLNNVPPGKGGLSAGATMCRYPLFGDGTEATVSSDGYILGAMYNFIPLDYLGVTAQEAVELLQTSEDRVFLGPAGTPADQLVEQPLTETAYKHTIDPYWGPIVYQVKGFVAQLEPGDYTSRYEWRWPIYAGNDNLYVDTVTLHVE